MEHLDERPLFANVFEEPFDQSMWIVTPIDLGCRLSTAGHRAGKVADCYGRGVGNRPNFRPSTSAQE